MTAKEKAAMKKMERLAKKAAKVWKMWHETADAFNDHRREMDRMGLWLDFCEKAGWAPGTGFNDIGA